MQYSGGTEQSVRKQAEPGQVRDAAAVVLMMIGTVVMSVALGFLVGWQWGLGLFGLVLTGTGLLLALGDTSATKVPSEPATRGQVREQPGRDR